nr:putative porin [Pontibacter vulgaris]
MLAGKSATAQIVDDSTRVLYSPKTTLKLYEEDVLQGKYTESRIDTSIQNTQNERYWFHDTTYYQHLGNVGTAAKPLFFNSPNKIGIRLGKNAFDRYAYNPERINYFNTRSPYSHIYYVQGSRGETVFEGIYARNISPTWNAGIAYNIVSATKQINVLSRRENLDNLIDHEGLKAFTHYRSKKGRYDLFANFTFMKHEQIEQGGVRRSETETGEDTFEYENDLAYLNQASNQEYRNNLHALQILKIAGEHLKAYHTIDYRTQRNEFKDDALPRDANNVLEFYPDTIINYDSVKTRDRTIYKELQNIVGFTGNSKISFYKAYVKHRNGNLEYSSVDSANVRKATDINRNQIFVGGQLRFNYKKALLQFDGEYQLAKDYRLMGVAKLGFLQFTQSRISQSPSLVQERYLSNHFDWNSNFENSVTDRSEATITAKLGAKQFVRIGANFNNIKRYIYFNQNAEAAQFSGSQRIFGGQIEHHIRFGPIHFENFAAYTNTDEAEAIRIPEWFVNSKLYFQGFLFKKALFGQFGVEMNLPTDYKPDAYMPVTQQFYLQDNFLFKTYPVVDVFITADIKTLNVFLKMAHVNEGWLEPGYYTTPGFPGMRRSFVFGIKWMFFD